MLRRGLESGDYALVVVVGVLGDLGIPHDLLGEYALAVDDRADLAVASAGVEADAAAVHVAAHGLRIAVLGGHGVAEHHLEGALVDIGHEVRVKLTRAAGAIGVLYGLVHGLAAAYIDLEAALHPEKHLYQAVNVVLVRLVHLRCAVDEGVVHRYFSAGALHGQRDGLGGSAEKGGEKFAQGDEAGVELRQVFDGDFDSKVVHNIYVLLFCGKYTVFFAYRLSAFLNLSRKFSGF